MEDRHTTTELQLRSRALILPARLPVCWQYFNNAVQVIGYGRGGGMGQVSQRKHFPKEGRQQARLKA